MVQKELGVKTRSTTKKETMVGVQAGHLKGLPKLKAPAKPEAPTSKTEHFTMSPADKRNAALIQAGLAPQIEKQAASTLSKKLFDGDSDMMEIPSQEEEKVSDNSSSSGCNDMLTILKNIEAKLDKSGVAITIVCPEFTW